MPIEGMNLFGPYELTYNRELLQDLISGITQLSYDYSSIQLLNEEEKKQKEKEKEIQYLQNEFAIFTCFLENRVH